MSEASFLLALGAACKLCNFVRWPLSNCIQWHGGHLCDLLLRFCCYRGNPLCSGCHDWIPNIWVCLGIGCVTNTLLLIIIIGTILRIKSKKYIGSYIWKKVWGLLPPRMYCDFKCHLPIFEPKLLLLCVVFPLTLL